MRGTGWRLPLLAMAYLWLPVALLLAWWYGSADSGSPYFPPLQTILLRLKELWLFDHAERDLLPSLRNLALGYGLGAACGVLVAALLWWQRWLARMAEPLIYLFYAMPAPALLPAVILIFGVDVPMKVFIIAFACFWPVLLNAHDGMRSTDTVKLEVAAAMRMGTWGKWHRVVLPAATPQLFAGLRSSLAVGIILMVVSEFSASINGIGYFILYSQQTYATTNMWTGILVLAVTGSLLNFLFIRLERRLLVWHYQARTTLGAP